MRISLNGNDWLFKGFLGEDWVWRNAEKPDTRDVRWWNAGAVPGSVHHDLLTLGEIPDPYVERNSLLVEWVPQRTWIYKKSFTADAAWLGQTVMLHFEGVDYSAQFFLNGLPLGSHRGMYTPAAFDVSDLVKHGEENLLSVVLDRAPDEEPQVSKTSYVKTHKSRMTYWWDFCPRMVHIGIWDDVYLEVTGPVQATDVYVRPQLAPDLARADLAVAVKLDSRVWTTATVETVVRFGGDLVAHSETQHALAPGEAALNVSLPVESPRLWWPNGHGEQPLYEAQVRVLVDGVEAHVRTTTFGIRHVEAVGNEGADASALKYTMIVNGKPIYVKGWNWVPIDVMYGVERQAKLERLLKLAKRANVNLLRVWGGGLIEKEAFYELCDRYGIMVWQEFIMSSSGIANKPSAEPAFIAMMVREAEQIIPKRRNHPSLVMWCGGNELMGDGGTPLTDAEPVLGALHDAVRRLDPDRHWLPTSPSGPASNNELAQIEQDPAGQHDVHGPWEHQGLTGQYTLYNRATSMFHSEFGAEGMAHMNVIDRTIAPQHQWPANRDNAVYFHRGSWWINEPLVQEMFGGIGGVATLSLASQFLQAEALRYALESNRRRQWRNSGSIPWQFNEPYPNSWCTAAVDYYTQPKAAYYAVARAYAPVAVTAKFDTQAWDGRPQFAADVWVANSTGVPVDATVLTRVIRFDGSVAFEARVPVTVAGNGANQAASVDCPLPDGAVFFLDLQLMGAGGELLAENFYPFVTGPNLKPLLDAKFAALSASADGERLTIINTGVVAAVQVRLESPRQLEAPGYVYFDTNHFFLLPGESRTVTVEWSGIPADERELIITGWNTEAVRVGYPHD